MRQWTGIVSMLSVFRNGRAAAAKESGNGVRALVSCTNLQIDGVASDVAHWRATESLFVCAV